MRVTKIFFCFESTHDILFLLITQYYFACWLLSYANSTQCRTGDVEDKYNLPKKPFFVPWRFEVQTEDGSISVRHANFLERIFITLEHPDQSIFGTWISIFIMIVIVVSCTCYVVSTMPELKYQPKYDANGKFCREDSPLTRGKEIQTFHCLDEDTCACEPKP